MDFGHPARPARVETIMPMVNLVFLLLIFFLMVATLAPRPPEPVEPPRVAGSAHLETDAVRISLGADGVTAHGGARGNAALTDLGAVLSEETVVAIHADRRAPASALARLLVDLDAMGVTRMRLVTEPVR